MDFSKCFSYFHKKSATETLEITEDNLNEDKFKKQPPVVIYKKSVLKYFGKFIGKHLC